MAAFMKNQLKYQIEKSNSKYEAVVDLHKRMFLCKAGSCMGYFEQGKIPSWLLK